MSTLPQTLNTHESVLTSASLIVLRKAVSPRAEVELLMVAIGVDQTVCWRRRRTKARLCIAAAAPITASLFFLLH